MPDRRLLSLAAAALAATLGLQLASCATIAPEPAAGGAAPPPALRPGTAATVAPRPPQAPAAPISAPGSAQVALLLPLGGRQAGAAASVRDGFLTAYYSAAATDRPALRIYDTSQLDVAAAIGTATRDGATLIVGPLTREEVGAAAAYGGPRPPLLALNALPAGHAAVRDFYQFALSPEDEARQVARRVLADGNRAGIALVPAGDWGGRVLAAFRDELQAGGGQLMAVATYDGSGSDYAAPIMELLRIDESEARRRRLESVLDTKLQFQPRRRADIGFIFVPGQAASERLLRPQLKFYFAGDVPTYATADAFEPDAAANQDMDGLMFPDAPWMLGGGLTDSVREATRAAWPTAGPRRDSLFAFGFDAWRLATFLRAQPGPGLSVDGLSGRLSIAPDGRVQRELQWAQMRGGEPQPLGAAPGAAPAETPAAAVPAVAPAGAAPAATPAAAPAGAPGAPIAAIPAGFPAGAAGR